MITQKICNAKQMLLNAAKKQAHDNDYWHQFESKQKPAWSNQRRTMHIQHEYIMQNLNAPDYWVVSCE